MPTRSYALFTPLISIGDGVATLTVTDTNDGAFEVPDSNPGGQTAEINGTPVTIQSVEAALGPQLVVASVDGVTVELSLVPIRIVVDGVVFDTTYIVYPGLPEGATVISVSLPLLFPNPTGLPVCLVTDSLVRTDKGYVRAGDLQIGDLVATLDDGFQPIRWIGKQKLLFRTPRENERFRPIVVEANALGEGVPRQALTVSPQHAFLLRSPFAMLMFCSSEVLVAAKHLVNGTSIRVDKTCTEVTYCHILLDMHAIIDAEGAPVESLYLGDLALRSIGSEARAEVFSIFPELIHRPQSGMERARLLLRAYEAAVLLDRMSAKDHTPEALWEPERRQKRRA